MSSPIKGQIKVLIAEGQPIYRLGLKRLLGAEEDFHVIATVGDGPEVLEAARKFQPEVLLLDRDIPGRDPFEIIRGVRRALPRSRIVLLSDSRTEEETAEAIRSGVGCVLPKEVTPQALVSALRNLGGGKTLPDSHPIPQTPDRFPAREPPEGGPALTAREMEIVSLIARGFRNKELAARLSLSEQTVKNTLRNVFDKLGVSDRLELALYAIHHRLLPASQTDSVNP